MFLPIIILALQAAPPATPPPYRSAPVTVVAEPIALLLASFDRDRDGRTSRAEARQGVDDFATTDAAWRQDVGYIAFAEWATRFLGDRNASPTPFEVDRNGDNRITLAELGDRIDAVVTRLDTNGDGMLSRAELLTVRSIPLNDNRRERRRRDDDLPPRPR